MVSTTFHHIYVAPYSSRAGGSEDTLPGRPRHTPPGRTALPVPPFSTSRTCPPPPMPQRRARQDQRSAPSAESRCFLNISCPFCNPRSRFLFLSFSDSFSDFSVVFSRCHRAAFSESHVVFQTPASRRAVQCCEAFKTEVSWWCCPPVIQFSRCWGTGPIRSLY